MSDLSDAWNSVKKFVTGSSPAPDDKEKKATMQRLYQPATSSLEAMLGGLNTTLTNRLAISQEISRTVPDAVKTGDSNAVKAALAAAVNKVLPGQGTDAAVGPVVAAVAGMQANFDKEANANLFKMSSDDIRVKLAGDMAVDRGSAAPNASNSLDGFIGGLNEPNRKKIKVAEALKASVGPLLEDATLSGVDLERKLKETIIKTVNENIEKPTTAPTEPEAKKKFEKEQADAAAALDKSASELASKLTLLKESKGNQARKEFETKLNDATPLLPVSNTTLIAGAAAGGAMLLAGDSVGDWTSLKGIAIKLGLIGATMGVAAFVNGDLTTSMFTGPKKPDEKAACASI